MQTITLPTDLNLDASKAIQVFDYCSSQEITRQQIALNQHTFSFLLEGTKEVVFADGVRSIDPANFLLMKSGHCLMTEKLAETRHYRSVLLFFSHEALQQFAQKVRVEPEQSLDSRSIHSFQYDDFIRRFVVSLLDISQLSADIQPRLLAVKLEEITWYLVEIYGKGWLNSLLSRKDDPSQRFIRVIERNQQAKLSLNALAFLCNMSISTFKRTFKKHYAETPMRWFQNKRLEYAHYLLQVEKKTATEIYLEVGYENLSSFIQAYKTKYGKTPKQDQIK